MTQLTVIPEGYPSWSYKTNISHYGGSLDKTNNTTEDDTPVAYVWYRVFQGALGTSFNQCPQGLVHAENLALARAGASVSRALEKLSNNSHPATADEKLMQWAEDLGIDIKVDDDVATVRSKADSKLKLVSGPIQYVINQILSRILSTAFVQTYRNHNNDLGDPPPKTYWPVINPGPQEYNLYKDGFKGPFTSERNHLSVVVEKPAFLSDDQFLRLLNGEFKRQMDLLMPAYCSFDWVLKKSFENGFELGVDRLDYHSVTYS